MKPDRLVRITLKNLKSQMFRAFLASLGVVLGVGSVIGMTSISEGAKQASLDQLKRLGVNNIILSSKEIKKGSDDSNGKSKIILKYGITKRDLNHIRTFENIQTVIPIRDLGQNIQLRGKSSDISVFASTPELFKVSHSTFVGKRSRFFTNIDSRNSAKVCVIGKDAARAFFEFKDPIGKTVSVGGDTFKVIGVIDSKVGYELDNGKRINNQIIVPFSTAMATYGERIINSSNLRFTQVYAHKVNIRVKSTSSLTNTAARIRNYLNKEHEEKDFHMTVPLELVRQQEKTQKLFTIVMGSIAAISLLVGGIGIMNIMLANIYERTREIGTRRALGATQGDIVLQFLCESTLMTGIGGSLGILVGFGIAHVVEVYGGMITIISMFSLSLSFSVAVATGIIFGTYPAWQASKLDPVVALRRE